MQQRFLSRPLASTWPAQLRHVNTAYLDGNPDLLCPLPAGVRDCYATRSPVLWRKAFQLWESLRRCSVRLSQAAAGVGVRAVPGAVPCNHLSREDSRDR